MTRYGKRPLNPTAQFLREVFAPVGALVRWLPENIDWTGQCAGGLAGMLAGHTTPAIEAARARWRNAPRATPDPEPVAFVHCLTPVGGYVQPCPSQPLPPVAWDYPPEPSRIAPAALQGGIQPQPPEPLYVRGKRGYRAIGVATPAGEPRYRRVLQGKRVRYEQVYTYGST